MGEGLELEEFAAEGAGVDCEGAGGRGAEGEGAGEEVVVDWRGGFLGGWGGGGGGGGGGAVREVVRMGERDGAFGG